MHCSLILSSNMAPKCLPKHRQKTIKTKHRTNSDLRNLSQQRNGKRVSIFTLFDEWFASSPMRFPFIRWGPLGSNEIRLIRWDLLGSSGIHWDPVGFTGIHWGPLGSAGIRWNTLGSVGIRWGLLGSAGVRWGPLGSAGIRFPWIPSDSLGLQFSANFSSHLLCFYRPTSHFNSNN